MQATSTDADRRWLLWGAGGALFALATLGAIWLRAHHTLALAVVITGGAAGFFLAGGSPFRTGVLERTRSMLSGSAWALGFIAAATLFFSWGSLYDALPFALTHSNHSITPLAGGGVVETNSGGASNMRQGLVMYPACLAVLGTLGLFLERLFLIRSFGDRPRLRWIAPPMAGIIFAVLGTLTMIFVPLMLYFLVAGSAGVGQGPAPVAAALLNLGIALLTGFAAGSGIGSGIDWLRTTTNSATD